MSNAQKGIFLAILTPVLWGLMSLPIRNVAAYGVTSQDLAFFRCLVSGCGLFLLHALSHTGAAKTDLRGVIFSGIYGIICYAASFTAYGISVSRIPVAVAMVLMFLCPVWVSLFNLIIFKERLKPLNTFCIVICLIGAVMVSKVLDVRGTKLDMIGVLTGIYNGMGAALQLIIPRYFQEKYGTYRKETFVIYGFLCSALVLAFFTKFDEVAAAVAASPAYVVVNIAGLAFICTLLANYSFVIASNYIDSTLVSILSAMEVVVGSLLGFVVFKETLTLTQSIGAVIIVIGAMLPNVVMYIKSRK